MKKKIVLISIILNVFLIGFLIYQKNNIISYEHDTTSIQDDQKKKFRIAILTPVSHSALENIEEAFRKKLNSYKDYSFECTTYNANGNEMLMRAQIEEVFQQSYDLIFSIAAHATQLTKEVAKKRGHDTPIVFGAVADPVRLGVVESEQSPGNHITGTSATTNYPDQVKLLLEFKPQTKTVLLVYDPTQSSGLERDKNELKKLFEEQRIHFNVVEIYKTSEMYQKVSSLLDNVDVVMTLKDNTIVSGLDSLVKLCNQRGITLFTSNLDSSDKGAVLAFGVQEQDFGTQAAPLVYKILVEGKHPSFVPVHVVNEFKLHINAACLKQQNVALSDSQLFLFKAVSIT